MNAPTMSPSLDSSEPNPKRRKHFGPCDVGRVPKPGNLGLGYLASTLRQHGYSVDVFDFETKPEVLLEAVLRRPPVLHRILTDLSVFTSTDTATSLTF
jgi:hypothetical protein